MKLSKITYGIIATLVMLSASIGAAPYTIRSASDSADVPGAEPLAVVYTSPFDDDSGILSDDLDHYYLVTDAAGERLLIAVEKNLDLDTLRISFDDEDPLSAPVDAALSIVTVSPSTIDADGESQAVVTVIPRDAEGVMLGTGLDIQIDGGSLWPGQVTGAVEDLGNGVYLIRVISTFSGSGSVQITVEGIVLSTMPEISYEETAGSGTLLEQAISLIDGLTENGGEFDQLLDLVSGDAADGVEDALNHALDGLTLLLSTDPDDHADAVSSELKRAIEHLVGVLDLVDPEVAAQVVDLIDSLLTAGRKVAMHYILEVSGDCGTCAETGERDLCKAEASLALGDAAWLDTPPNHMEAITKYGLAIRQAVRASGNCL